MRSAALLFVLAVSCYAAKAQLTILPQAGVENPLTRISYNDLSDLRPVSELQPKLSLRVDYKFKNGFGPFAGLSTSRSMINYEFNDPENGMYVYRATAGSYQLQLQAGLQYSTKPLYFNKQSSSSSSAKPKAEKSSGKTSCSRTPERTMAKNNCGSYTAKNHCSGKSSSAQKARKQDKGSFVRIQPFAGLGYIPSNKPDLVTKTSGSQTSYTYNAGNINTALLTGVGFEFGKNSRRSLALSINYFKGLGNNETVLTTETGSKTVTTNLNSKVSGWSASLGIPISLAKKPAVKHKKVEQKKKSDCQQYKIQYKSRCGKVI